MILGMGVTMLEGGTDSTTRSAVQEESLRNRHVTGRRKHKRSDCLFARPQIGEHALSGLLDHAARCKLH